jgi:acetolactate synthase-1/2/3 large subunit
MANKPPRPILSANDAYVTNKPNMTVADLLLDYLKLEGVNKIFGIPGGAVIYLADALMKRQDEFEFVVCRHETGAAYIAHGYSVVSGTLGVVLTTSGPAATNAITGSMNAQASSAALLTITGECAEANFGRGYLQEGIDAKLDVNVIYKNAVEYSAIITGPENFQTLFQQALRDALSQPQKAAHISLPNNVGGACMAAAGGQVAFPNSPMRYRAVSTATDIKQTTASLHELLGARRPLLFLGNGSRLALSNQTRRDRLMAFCNRFAIPVMTTPDAKGIYPESDSMSLRNFGMTACQWPMVYMGPAEIKAGDKMVPNPEHFDVLMVFGSALGELATSVMATDHWTKMLVPTKSFVQVDLNPSMIARDYPVTRGIVADVGATLDALLDAADDHQPAAGTETRRSAIAAIRHDPNSAFDDPAGRAFTGAPVHPAAMCRVIQEQMKSGHVFIDAGNCVGWSLNNMVIDPPVQYHSALDMGPMGFAVGAVIGAKLADPDNPAIAIVGDGAFMMHGVEISTACQSQVGAIWVVMYNDDLAMVSQGMADLFPPSNDWRDYYKLGAPDLAKFSEGLGANAVQVSPTDDLNTFENALNVAIELADKTKQPQVIVVHINRAAIPKYGWPTLQPSNCA